MVDIILPYDYPRDLFITSVNSIPADPPKDPQIRDDYFGPLMTRLCQEARRFEKVKGDPDLEKAVEKVLSWITPKVAVGSLVDKVSQTPVICPKCLALVNSPPLKPVTPASPPVLQL